MVERHLAKVEVAGSSPVIRSIKSRSKERDFFFSQSGRGIESRQSLKSDAGSPVRSRVVAYRLVKLGSADSRSADFTSEKPSFRRFFLVRP